MGASGVMIAIVVALALLWLVIAAAVAVLAARRFQLAQQVLDAARANARLLELMPARPFLVGPDQRLEVDEQLFRNLGLKSEPKKLSELAGNYSGIVAEDLEALVADIEAAQARFPRLAEIPFESERRFMATVHGDGDRARVVVKGAPDVVLGRCSDGKYPIQPPRRTQRNPTWPVVVSIGWA